MKNKNETKTPTDYDEARGFVVVGERGFLAEPDRRHWATDATLLSTAILYHTGTVVMASPRPVTKVGYRDFIHRRTEACQRTNDATGVRFSAFDPKVNIAR